MQLSYTVDFEPWAQPLHVAAVRAKNPGPALREVGDWLVKMVQGNLESSGGPRHWAALSASTLLARARDPSGLGRRAQSARAVGRSTRAPLGTVKPLIWTRALYRSIKFVAGDSWVDVGSTMVKSWTLFLGSRTGKLPIVPARFPFGRFSGDDRQIGRILVRHIFASLVRVLH